MQAQKHHLRRCWHMVICDVSLRSPSIDCCHERLHEAAGLTDNASALAAIAQRLPRVAQAGPAEDIELNTCGRFHGAVPRYLHYNALPNCRTITRNHQRARRLTSSCSRRATSTAPNYRKHIVPLLGVASTDQCLDPTARHEISLQSGYPSFEGQKHVSIAQESLGPRLV